MRRWSAPLSVTLPPPSITTSGSALFMILAVAVSVIVIGLGPQSKVMMPPSATVATTAADVQLAAVPSPITWVGWDVSTARASGGTAAVPFGLPGGGGAQALARSATLAPTTMAHGTIRLVLTASCNGSDRAELEPAPTGGTPDEASPTEVC